MQLGNFSVSLAVKNIKVSRAFYKKLGFTLIGGVEDEKWLIMRNGNATIGLFQGMFEKNILTFNPGWDENGKTLDSFTDVRELQKAVKKTGIKIDIGADGTSEGPASFVIMDPDGNPVLFDQHV